MKTALLLDAAEAAGVVAELMPFIWIILVMVPASYLVSIALLVIGKSTRQRIAGWILAILQMGIGVYIMSSPTNVWGLYSTLFYLPILVGVATEYWHRQNAPHA